MKKTKDLVQNIVSACQEKKAKDISVINLTKLPDTICQYFVICQGNSSSQVSAIAEEIVVNIKKKEENPIATDGIREGRWVGIDYGTVIVHIFLPELRAFYNLEGLWADGKIENIPNID